MTKVQIIKVPTDEDWLAMRNQSLGALRKSSHNTPSPELRSKYLASEHSPMYNLQYSWRWIDLPYWISVHFVRHNIGINHTVSSQRNDVQKNYDRRKAPQDALVNHLCVANPVSIISVSHSRLCLTASSQTRDAWRLFLKELGKHDPEIIKFCVKPCIYRGLCPEVFSGCRYMSSDKFREEREVYKNIFLNNKNE